MAKKTEKTKEIVLNTGITGLEPGDIFRCKASGPLAWANSNLTAPRTEWFHHGMLWFPLKHDGLEDWATIESTTQRYGVGVGLLSWSQKGPLSFLRVDAPEDIRHEAPKALIPQGLCKYDYLLFVKLAFGGLQGYLKVFFIDHQIRKLKAEDFPYGKDNALICTEAVQVAYLTMGFPIIDPQIVPIPAAFEQAIKDGVLMEIGHYEYSKRSK